MGSISSDIIRGYNDTMILYLLWDMPSYGYEISKRIKSLSEEKYVIKETTLYSAFTRLEKMVLSSPIPRMLQSTENVGHIIKSQSRAGSIIARNVQSGH